MEALEYHEIMRRCGGDQRELHRKERWTVTQRWREVFAASLHAASGKWKLDQFEWHVFSGGYTKALAMTSMGLGPYFARREWAEQLRRA